MRASYPELGAALVPVPDVMVWAQPFPGGASSPSVKTDFFGRFHIPRQPNGQYKICWSKPGFNSGCSSSPFAISNADIGVGSLGVVPTPSTRIRGHVTLADDSKCLAVDSFFGVQVSAQAEMLNSANQVIQSVQPNNAGDFILPMDSTAAKLQVKCGTITQDYSLTQLDRTGASALNVVFRNERPQIQRIAATAGSVNARRGVGPNTTVTLDATVIDPNGDPMKYVWKAPENEGVLINTGTTTATWQVPASPGTVSAYLKADDGRGGVTIRRVDVVVRNVAEALFSGSVRTKQKGVVAGAAVTVAGKTVTTDANGYFVVKVPEAQNYVFNVEKTGFGEYSTRLVKPSRGLNFVLTEAYKKVIDDPSVTTVIEDLREDWLRGEPGQGKRRGGRVTIPGGALLLSPPPVGPLSAYVTTYDPTTENIPGDQTATNSASQTVALVSYGAFSVEIRDSIGQKYNLAPGKTAKIEMPIQDTILTGEKVPASIDSWTYDLSTGTWKELSQAGQRSGNYFVFNVPSFSTKNSDIEKANPACLRVNFDATLPTDGSMRVRLDVDMGTNSYRRKEFDVDDSTMVFYNLPANTPYILQVFESGSLKFNQSGLTGTPWGGVGDPGENNPACTDKFVAESAIVANNGAVFNTFLTFKGLGDLATAQAYYAFIDPSSERDTLKKFFLKNGFGADGSGGTRTYFVNHNDLGLGRDMHCLQDVDKVACYVTNYGLPDQSPGNFAAAQAAIKSSAVATVAMEYSPIEGQGSTKVVKFYAYAGGCSDAIPECCDNSVSPPVCISSNRIFSANLDTSGPKFIPNLCNNCHGGTYQGGGTGVTFAQVNMGSSFREFDLYSFRDGLAGDLVSTAGITAQETNFHTQNQMVLASQPLGPIQELVNIFYQPGPSFNPDAVPCGWKATNANPAACNGFAGTGNASTEELYKNVVAKSCRTCHAALLDPSKQWDTYNKFRTFRNGIYYAVCQSDPRYMPHSVVTFHNLWLNYRPASDPLGASGPGLLGSYTGPSWPAALGPCDP